MEITRELGPDGASGACGEKRSEGVLVEGADPLDRGSSSDRVEARGDLGAFRRASGQGDRGPITPSDEHRHGGEGTGIDEVKVVDDDQSVAADRLDEPISGSMMVVLCSVGPERGGTEEPPQRTELRVLLDEAAPDPLDGTVVPSRDLVEAVGLPTPSGPDDQSRRGHVGRW